MIPQMLMIIFPKNQKKNHLNQRHAFRPHLIPPPSPLFLSLPFHPPSHPPPPPALQTGDFGGDNRAGIDRTLHRISAIRNRSGKVVGLTCRVGRAIPGSAEMVEDLVAMGSSLLLMGPPGVGKTTAIRLGNG